MWLVTLVLALALVGILAFASRRWRDPRHLDLGWMSQQWLAEHRAGSRS